MWLEPIAAKRDESLRCSLIEIASNIPAPGMMAHIGAPQNAASAVVNIARYAIIGPPGIWGDQSVIRTTAVTFDDLIGYGQPNTPVDMVRAHLSFNRGCEKH